MGTTCKQLKQLLSLCWWIYHYNYPSAVKVDLLRSYDGDERSSEYSEYTREPLGDKEVRAV